MALRRSRTETLLLLFDAGLRLGVVVSKVRLKRGWTERMAVADNPPREIRTLIDNDINAFNT